MAPEMNRHDFPRRLARRVCSFSWLVLLFGCGPSVMMVVDDGSESTSTDRSALSDDESTGSAGDSATVEPGNDSDLFFDGCFSADILGQRILAHPSGLEVYAGCDNGYLIQHPGLTAADTTDEWVDALGTWFLGIPGVTASEIGRCCDKITQLCLRLYTQVYDINLSTLLDALAEKLAAAEEWCFGVRVIPIGWDAPRCEKFEQQCLPLPYCNHGFDDDCCSTPEFDPEATRLPVDLEMLSEGSCGYDGECVINGDNRCTSYQVPEIESVGYLCDELGQAFCGCVDAACRWFELD